MEACDNAGSLSVMSSPAPTVLPSVEPPAGVELRLGWVVAAQFWRAHTPAEVPGRCGRCLLPWPCWSVRWADEFLNSLVLSPDELVAMQRTRETQLIPRL